MYECRTCGGTINIPAKGKTVTCPYCGTAQPHPAANEPLTREEQAQLDRETAKKHRQAQKDFRAVVKQHRHKNWLMLGICLATHLLAALFTAAMFPLFSPQMTERLSPAFLLEFFGIGLAMYAVVNGATILLTILTFLLAFTKADAPLYTISRAITAVGCALLLIGPLGFFELNMAQNLCILLFCTGVSHVISFILLGYRKTSQNSD